MFNEPIQVDYVYNAHKPSTKNYRKAMEIMGTDETNSVLDVYKRQLQDDAYCAAAL